VKKLAHGWNGWNGFPLLYKFFIERSNLCKSAKSAVKKNWPTDGTDITVSTAFIVYI
jgi:hypothetical protein